MKKLNLRFRHMFMHVGSLFVFVLMILLDPNMNIVQNLPFGASTLVLLDTLLKSIWYISLLHAALRAMFDYIDKKNLFEIAEKTPEGAGMSLIAMGIFAVAIAIAMAAAVMSN